MDTVLFDTLTYTNNSVMLTLNSCYYGYPVKITLQSVMIS